MQETTGDLALALQRERWRRDRKGSERIRLYEPGGKVSQVGEFMTERGYTERRGTDRGQMMGMRGILIEGKTRVPAIRPHLQPLSGLRTQIIYYWRSPVMHNFSFAPTLPSSTMTLSKHPKPLGAHQAIGSECLEWVIGCVGGEEVETAEWRKASDGLESREWRNPCGQKLPLDNKGKCVNQVNRERVWEQPG